MVTGKSMGHYLHILKEKEIWELYFQEPIDIFYLVSSLQKVESDSGLPLQYCNELFYYNRLLHTSFVMVRNRDTLFGSTWGL